MTGLVICRYEYWCNYWLWNKVSSVSNSIFQNFQFLPTNATLGTELAEFSESSCSSQTILIVDELPLAFFLGSEPFGSADCKAVEFSFRKAFW